MRKFTSFSLFGLILILMFALATFAGCDSAEDEEARGLGDDDDDDDTSSTDDDDDDSGDDDDDDDDDDDTTGSSWTFLVYMAADNDLEEHAHVDLSEMTSVGSTNNVNVLVVFDGVSPNDSRYYRVQKDELVVQEQPSELNMGDPDTLKAAASWAYSNYPADRYALVLWSHGTGWHKGSKGATYKYICEDYSGGDDWLNNTELDSALAWIRNNTDANPINLMGFDACLMQMIEIAYYIKDDARVLVGSQENESVNGWDYAGVLDALVANPSMTPDALGTTIAQTFVAIPDATQSALDLTKVQALADAVDTLADELVKVGGIGYYKVQNALYEACYFSDWDYIDLYDFADKIIDQDVNNDTTSAAQGVKSAVENCVIYSGVGAGYGDLDAHGVSIYFPDPDFSVFDIGYLDLAFAQDTDWDDVIH